MVLLVWPQWTGHTRLNPKKIQQQFRGLHPDPDSEMRGSERPMQTNTDKTHFYKLTSSASVRQRQTLYVEEVP